jgi:hypothetical protein
LFFLPLLKFSLFFEKKEKKFSSACVLRIETFSYLLGVSYAAEGASASEEGMPRRALSLKCGGQS